MRYRSILLLGPPGSGKGTVGRMVALAGGHVHVSSGEIFRGLPPTSSASKCCKSYVDKGLLLPDEVVLQIWTRYVDGLIATNRYDPDQQLLLLDGIPRTLAQARLLEPVIDVLHVVVLEIADFGTLARRMTQRGVAEHRGDDQDEAVFRTRMQVYEEETRPLVDHYSKELVARVHANQSRVGVLRDVLIKLAPMLSFRGA